MDDQASCQCGKRRYLSRKFAKLAAKRMAGTAGQKVQKMRAYQCEGGFWHLTSQPEKELTWFRDHPEHSRYGAEHNQRLWFHVKPATVRDPSLII